MTKKGVTPNIVFVDTTEFDSQRYDFAGPVLSKFAEACKEHNVTLLLPHPTELEIRRHVKDLAIKHTKKLADDVDGQFNQIPFLRQWKFKPDTANLRQVAKMAPMAAHAELEKYLKRFRVQKAAYDDVNIREIMRWYDAIKPPFKEGDKRKEFPDAFAVAIALGVAQRKGEPVAVVSGDGDVRDACKRYPRLPFYASLALFTDRLISDATDVAPLRAAVLSSDLMETAVLEEVDWLQLANLSPSSLSDMRDSEFSDFALSNVNVLSVGEKDNTVAYDGTVTLRAEIAWFEGTEDDEPVEVGYWSRFALKFSGASKVVVDESSWTVVEVVSTEMTLTGVTEID